MYIKNPSLKALHGNSHKLASTTVCHYRLQYRDSQQMLLLSQSVVWVLHLFCLHFTAKWIKSLQNAVGQNNLQFSFEQPNTSLYQYISEINDTICKLKQSDRASSLISPLKKSFYLPKRNDWTGLQKASDFPSPSVNCRNRVSSIRRHKSELMWQRVMKQLSNRPAHGPSCHTADKPGPNAGMELVNRLRAS